MNNTSEKELLIYILTSAAGLINEPKIYGPQRLIESARRLAEIIKSQEPDNETLEQIIRTIESANGTSMTDPEKFQNMLQEVVLLSVDLA